MGSASHLKRGPRLYVTLLAAWVVTSTMTLARPAAGAHNPKAGPAEANTQASDPSEPVMRPEPVDQGRNKRGISPPWHEPWIPELRHPPGKPSRKTTV